MNKHMASLLKFGVVGIFNTGIDLLVFALLTSAGMAILSSQWISYGCGTLNSYLWNRSWTFQRKSKWEHRELIRFMIINLAALSAAEAVLFVLNEHYHLTLAVSKGAATIAGVLINYTGSRYWVFGVPEKQGVSTHEN